MSAVTLEAWWWRHARVPLALGAILLVVIQLADLDPIWARLLFFDTAHHAWRGAHSWWAEDLVHGLGGWMVRGLGVTALLVMAAACLMRRYRPYRRAAVYLFVAVGSTTAIVGALKATTGIDCPWDLAMFGGTQPYANLLSDRSAVPASGACFPAAHAASGYAWMALYFLACERSRKWARRGLLFGMTIGLVFGLAQQSRGAHFLSHDLASAVLAWVLPLTLYVYGFRARLWHPPLVANRWPATDLTLSVRQTST